MKDTEPGSLWWESDGFQLHHNGLRMLIADKRKAYRASTKSDSVMPSKPFEPLPYEPAQISNMLKIA